MNEIIEYTPDIPLTDKTLLPAQNRSMFGEITLDWIPYPPILFNLPNWDRWN